MKELKNILGICLLLLLVNACDGCTSKTEQPQEKAIVQTETPKEEEVVKDTTQWGVCGESGMSTFCLNTSNESLLLSKTSDKGDYAPIYGRILEGDSFAIVTTDKNQSLLRAINISLLKKHLQDYSIKNAELYITIDGKEEKATILKLNKQVLKVKINDEIKVFR